MSVPPGGGEGAVSGDGWEQIRPGLWARGALRVCRVASIWQASADGGESWVGACSFIDVAMVLAHQLAGSPRDEP